MAELEGFASGEARDAGEAFVARARATGATVVVWSGETTVALPSDGPVGRGGRSQELVLGASRRIEQELVLSFGTDGVDGTSGAAGALFDERARAAAEHAGLDADAHLAAHDADAFFARTGTRVVTGATGTNVADVIIFVRDRWLSRS